MKFQRCFGRRGQVTLFIILAVVIVGVVITYFVLRGKSVGETIHPELRPVYDYYLSCLEDTSSQGILILESQGGYIETPDFEPGSSYMPFSSHLDFLGQGIPYWMYVSGNNIVREQVPTKSQMESQLGDYISKRISYCDFSDFERMGYDVYIGEEESVKTKIDSLKVDVEVKNLLTIFYGNRSAVIKNHKFSVDSKLGKFYEIASDIYNLEKEKVFLENYALDVMRLYAPVTGVEISCVPKIFVDEEIRKEIVDGLSANIQTLKIEGSYYSLSSKERNYFVEKSNLKVDENVNFLYSPDWPTRIEIYGERVANPVGLQQGMGILGFCYVPYQLIYDINFPVLIQIYDDKEIFQFPVAVIISKNQARQSLSSLEGRSIESPVCEFKNHLVKVYTYDFELNPILARIQFKCLNSICNIGETKIVDGNAVLEGQFPQCVNGFIIASAEGYTDAKYRISTNEDDLVNIIMNKKYNLNLDLGDVKKALVSFISEDYSAMAFYPDMSSIELIDGYYNVSVYVYENSSLRFPTINERKCVDVPETGLAGLFGVEIEKCFDINIPETEVSYAIVGGGKTQEYFTENQLRNSRELNINVPFFSLPKTLEDLQKNQMAAEDEMVYLSLE